MLKGETSHRKVVAYALGIMTIVIGLGAMGSINASVIQPNKDNLVDSFSEFGTQTVEIESEAQFRELTIYNMLTAANCNLAEIYSSSSNNNPDWLKYTTTGFTNLEETNFEIRNNCVERIGIDIAEDAQAVLTQPGNANTEAGSDLEGRQGKVKFNITNEFILNGGHNDNGELIQMDLSGIEGETGVNLGWWDNAQPDFWTGDRITAFVPDGITGTGGAWEVKHHELFGQRNDQNSYSVNRYGGTASDSNTFESGEDDFSTAWIESDPDASDVAMLYYYRVRMKNVPIIIDTNEWRKISGDNSDDGTDSISRLEKFVEDAAYVFCDGSSGYIQSNAKYMNYGGEASGSNANKENAVYPLIEITNGGRDCLDQHIVDWADYLKYAGTALPGTAITSTANGANNGYCSKGDAMSGKTANMDVEWTGPNDNNWQTSNIEYECKLTPQNMNNGLRGYTNNDIPYYEAGYVLRNGRCPASGENVYRARYDISSQYDIMYADSYARGNIKEGSEVTNGIIETIVNKGERGPNSGAPTLRGPPIRYDIEKLDIDGMSTIEATVDIRKQDSNDAPGNVYIDIGNQNNQVRIGEIDWTRNKFKIRVKDGLQSGSWNEWVEYNYGDSNTERIKIVFGKTAEPEETFLTIRKQDGDGGDYFLNPNLSVSGSNFDANWFQAVTDEDGSDSDRWMSAAFENVIGFGDKIPGCIN